MGLCAVLLLNHVVFVCLIVSLLSCKTSFFYKSIYSKFITVLLKNFNLFSSGLVKGTEIFIDFQMIFLKRESMKKINWWKKWKVKLSNKITSIITVPRKAPCKTPFSKFLTNRETFWRPLLGSSQRSYQLQESIENLIVWIYENYVFFTKWHKKHKSSLAKFYYLKSEALLNFICLKYN